MIDTRDEKKDENSRLSPTDPLEEVDLGTDDHKKIARIGTKLSISLKERTIESLVINRLIFAWG